MTCHRDLATSHHSCPPVSRRNPRVFSGRYITLTRREDGSLRANFRPLKIDKDFSVERFALGVYNELCVALGGLVEENVKM